MNKLTLPLLIFTFVLQSSMVMGNSRTWTSTDGRTINARFISANDESVTVSISGRKTIIPLERLSQEDKDFVSANRKIKLDPAPVRLPKEKSEFQDDGRYIIATTAAIAQKSEVLTQFIEHKRTRGLKVELWTEEKWMGTETTSAADSFRDYLKKQYIHSSISYLLIIGDPRQEEGPIPMKEVWPRNKGTEGYKNCAFESKSVLTDFYYANINGNWDLDGDGKYGEFGEADLEGFPTGDFGDEGITQGYQILCGRIPVYGDAKREKSQHQKGLKALDSILSKIIYYQTRPRDQIEWRKTALIAAEGMNRLHFGETLVKDIFDPEKFSNVRVYDTEEAEKEGKPIPNLNTDPDQSVCSIKTVKESWLEKRPGVVTWLTHGGGVGAANIMSSPDSADLNDEYPVFTFQASCHNSMPKDSNNLSYSLLQNGAIATVGATEVSHGPGTAVDLNDAMHQSGNAGMAYGFFQNLVSENLPVGQALMEAKMRVLDERCYYWQNHVGFNLYGDPEVSLLDSKE